MSKRNGAQTVELVPGRNVIISSAIGRTNLNEIRWLSKTILNEAASWESTGWAYIADCSQMTPVFPAESTELVAMTKKFVEAGCRAIGFIEGKSFMLRIQTHRHTEMSQTSVAEGHFSTVQEALDWIAKEVQY